MEPVLLFLTGTRHGGPGDRIVEREEHAEYVSPACLDHLVRFQPDLLEPQFQGSGECLCDEAERRSFRRGTPDLEVDGVLH